MKEPVNVTQDIPDQPVSTRVVIRAMTMVLPQYHFSALATVIPALLGQPVTSVMLLTIIFAPKPKKVPLSASHVHSAMPTRIAAVVGIVAEGCVNVHRDILGSNVNLARRTTIVISLQIPVCIASRM